MENRKTGKTTKLIDEAIQYLFNTGELYLFRRGKLVENSKIPRDTRLFVDPDHARENRAQEEFITRLVGRLRLEHYNSVNLFSNVSYVHIEVKNSGE